MLKSFGKFKFLNLEENETLTANGFSSHLQLDKLKLEEVGRWRDFASTGNLLTPGCTGVFLPAADF